MNYCRELILYRRKYGVNDNGYNNYPYGEFSNDIYFYQIAFS